jgi:hypothetical protein
MKKRVSEMPQTEAPNLLQVEVERKGSIHLVMPSQAMPAPPIVVSGINLPRLTPRRSHHIRESEKMSTVALASAALLAPAIWLGHALLVWFDVLKKQL